MASSTQTPIIFTIARMNPPHPGHMFLVSELLVDALQQNATSIYLLLSNSQDGTDNPLECDNTEQEIDKKRLVGEMVSNVKSQMAAATQKLKDKLQGIEIVIKCFSQNPFSSLAGIISNKQDIDLRMIVGIDRSSFFTSFRNWYLLNDTNVNKVQVRLLTRSEDDSEDDESSVQSMSATKIRNLVREYKKSSDEGKKVIMNNLSQYYEGYVEPTNVETLVDVLSQNLEDIKTKNKNARKPKPKPKPAASDGLLLTEMRGSATWYNLLEQQIEKKIFESNNPKSNVTKANTDYSKKWLSWANQQMVSRDEVGVGVGGKPTKSKKPMKTKKRITFRNNKGRVKRNTKRNNYKK